MKYKFLSCVNGQLHGAYNPPMDLVDAIELMPDCHLWHRREDMIREVEQWARRSKRGDMFLMVSSMLICVGENNTEPTDCLYCHFNDLEYGELTANEDEFVTQRVACPNCGQVYVDSFVFAERTPL